MDKIIRAARRPALGEPSSCDAAEVLASGWASGRRWPRTRAGRGTWSARTSRCRSRCTRADLGAAADALLGNVFRHTAEGTAFAVTCTPATASWPSSSRTPGPASPTPGRRCGAAAAARGSTGLGLDIARRVAESTGGEVRIDRSVLGGAEVQMWLRTGGPPVSRGRRAGRQAAA